MTQSTWLEVGLGLNGEVRDMLGKLQLVDPSLRWHEGSGWITRRYDIVGSATSIARIKRAAAQFNAAVAPPLDAPATK